MMVYECCGGSHPVQEVGITELPGTVNSSNKHDRMKLDLYAFM
jgi:hypothetical protein